MKLKYLYGFFTVSVLLTLSSCEDWFDINTSPDNPVVVTVDQSMPLVLAFASQLCFDHADYGVYLSQALTTGGRSQTGTYAYKSGWEFLGMNRHPQWRRHFYDIGVNATELIKAAEKIDAKNAILVARTIMLHSTLLTTDAFGDMPRSQVYQSNTPPYDSQGSIYEWMLKEADDLIALYNDNEWVNNPANIIITKTMDRMFEGDMGKWRAFTKSLKARMLLRKLPNWDNTPATCDLIIKAVDDALNDPDFAEAIYKYDGGTISEKNCPWGPAQPSLNLGWAQARQNLLAEAIPSRFFGSALLGFYPSTAFLQSRGQALDPRAVKMMTPRVDDGGFTTMRFLDNNIGMDASMKITYFPNLFAPNGANPFTRDDGYIALMMREELLFIKAEAQYWKRDVQGAYETTVAAVNLNFERYDAMPTTTREEGWYKLFMDVRLPGAAVFTLADLMQQKYVVMYLQPEQWTDVRRYNYSSETNGIAYDGEFIYTIKTCHDGSRGVNVSNFNVKISLTRPFNLYDAYWTTPGNFGTNARFSPNAWITRLNYDPETEDKYNIKQLEALGAYKNPEWLKKRMIWAYKNNSYVTSADNIEWK